jgi:transitional endoplasmic reticulum ATPase
MNSLSKSVNPTVELLYVKTLSSFGGPEFSIRQIFTKARATAPCLLIFEDIDSLVTPFVRSYFLNEVDGLESNHGILMIGSTNHLERLDPGISKRPSRFDRKYLFSLPNHDERVLYCEYWRKKLSGNEKIDFPKELSVMIADITDEFSFAYMKEAFVASLLSIVARLRERPDRVTSEFVENLGHNEIATAVDGDDDDDDGKNKAERSILWKEIKKQVKNLRDEMDNESVDQAEGMHGITWDLPSRDRASRPVFRGIPPSARPSFAM